MADPFTQPTPVNPRNDPAIPGIQGGSGALGPPVRTPEPVPPSDPAAAAANFNTATNQSFLAAIGVPTPIQPQNAQAVPIQSLDDLKRNVISNAPAGFDPVTNRAVSSPGFQGKSSVSANNTPSKQAGKSAATSSSEATKTSTFRPAPDWRVRVSLAQGASYFYNAADAGILAPLKPTNGVIFPYTPSISVSYTATYDTTQLTHSNYNILSYQGSAVNSVSITGEFTAQDTLEANYLLAVIHFFRTCTKMFYGQDTNPINGTPPPLVYLTGLGAYQFDNHPMVITNFSLQLPDNVDYIRAVKNPTQISLASLKNVPAASTGLADTIRRRLFGARLQPGGAATPPAFRSLSPSGSDITYVPTKMQISISALPIVTRNDISNNFSLRDYASGKLLRGSQRTGTPTVSGGIW